MPNYCDYSMKVKGKKADVELFYQWLSAHYDYSKEVNIHVYTVPEGTDTWGRVDDSVKIPCEHHIGYRVFEAYKDFAEELNSGEYLMGISGDCAWSVMSCMFNKGFGTYMGDRTYGRPEDRAISIDDASKKLGLEIEIFSSEPGMCFSEHYYIKNGDVKCQEETEFTELWTEYFDKKSDCFEEEAYNELTDDMKKRIDEAIELGIDVIMDCEFFCEDTNQWLWEYI